MLDVLSQRNLVKNVTKNFHNICNAGAVVYTGIDATGPHLHVGHMLPLLTLDRFIKAGHKGIVLIGGATAQIGDPSGKKGERPLIETSTVNDNVASLSIEINKLLPDVEIVNNVDWIKDINTLSFLREYGKYFSVNEMLSKDCVLGRLETGISFTEFSYQILQAIDFLHLVKNKGCNIQIGGSDQWGNITAGLELIRKSEPTLTVAGMTIPLLTKSDGTKMGKTESGAIWLNPSKTSPFKFFQYWRNIDDSLVEELLLQTTQISSSVISSIMTKHKENPNLGIAQNVLAFQLTRIIHGLDEARKVQIASDTIFHKEDVPPQEVLELLSVEIPHVQAGSDDSIVDIFSKCFELSKSQIRRDLSTRGITINNEVVSESSNFIDKYGSSGKYHFLRKGKKHYGIAII